MTRRSKSIRDTSSNTEWFQDDFTLSGMLQTQWKIHHTSLLLDSRRDHQSKILPTTHLIAQENGHKNKSYDVRFTTCPAIRRSQQTPPAFLVEVSFDKESVYMGYFVNWSASHEPIENFDALPLLLVKAKTEMTRIVHNALIKVFDFVITPIELNSLQLASLFAVFVWSADKDEEGMSVLKYTVPGLARKHQITTSTRVRDLALIFDFYNESPLEEHQEIERVFNEKVLSHFRKSYGLNLARAELRQVTLPDASVSDTGLVRFNNEDVLTATLVTIDSIFPKRSPPPPSLSFPSWSET